jgi:hypothetical protein
MGAVRTRQEALRLPAEVRRALEATPGHSQHRVVVTQPLPAAARRARRTDLGKRLGGARDVFQVSPNLEWLGPFRAASLGCVEGLPARLGHST